jgi:hypothetical protein
VDTARDTRAREKPTASRRALRVALERCEILNLQLEEKEWEREALETRAIEAERLVEEVTARNQSPTTIDPPGRLKEEMDRNGYLRRLLAKAEQRRGEARGREKDAVSAYEALLKTRKREEDEFARVSARLEDELRGARLRVGAERSRNLALERALANANVELAEQHGHRRNASRVLGAAIAATCVLLLRILAGGRGGSIAHGTYGGGRDGKYGRDAYIAEAAARAAKLKTDGAARSNPTAGAGFGSAV